MRMPAINIIREECFPHRSAVSGFTAGRAGGRAHICCIETEPKTPQRGFLLAVFYSTQTRLPWGGSAVFSVVPPHFHNPLENSLRFTSRV